MSIATNHRTENGKSKLIWPYTGNVTLVPDHNGGVIVVTSSADVNLTVPTLLPVGFHCQIEQCGAGKVAFAASGTVIYNRQSFTRTAGQYAVAYIDSKAPDVFVTSGDLALGDVTAPTVPTMAASSGVSSTAITWNWNASTDDTAVTGYDLQVATDAGFTANLRTINLGNVLTYADTGLTPSTTYYARVRAHDAVPNNSAYSSSTNTATSAAPDVTAPTVPAGLTPTVISSSEIDLTWSASTDAVGVTGYDLQRATDAGFTAALVTINLGNVLSYNNTGLTAATQYYYRVRAHDLAGNNSAYSSSVNATTSAVSGVAAIASLERWYAIADLSGNADGTAISSWTDRKAGVNATATGTQKPLYKTGSGSPYLLFDGSDDEMDIAESAKADHAYWMVFEWTSDAGDYHRVLEDGVIALYGFTSTGRNLFVYNNANGTSFTLPAAPTGFMALYVECSNTALKARLNGTEHLFTLSGSGATGTTMRIGAYSSAGFNANIKVKEFGMCTDNLGTTDFATLASYISTTYGLTL